MNNHRRRFLHELAAAALATTTVSAAPALNLQRSFKTRELAQLDAVALGELIQRKQLTPLELLNDVLQRIEQINPQLNAVVPKLFDTALAKARAQGTLGNSALSGVPILLKNIAQYTQADIDFGSRLYQKANAKNGRQFKTNSPLLTAVEAAGMIIAGVTNAPEFGLIESTESLAHGAAHSPWNPAYTTGGSSGGSAAAVAAGLVPLAHANDGGGSIRIPASQCGVFGLKPTRRRELAGFTEGMFALDTVGITSDLCVSRSVRDTAAFLNIVERKDNPALPPTGLVSGPASKRLKIGLVIDGLNGKRADAEVEKAVRATAKLCESLKHTVAEIKLPLNGAELSEAFLGYWSAGTVGLAGEIEKLLGKGVAHADVLEPWTIGLMELGRKRGIFQIINAANKAFATAANQLETVFKTYDVLLSPVLRIPPFKLGQHDPRVPFDTLMERVLDTAVYTPLHNLCGTPAMSVPLYWTKDNLPIGSQFAAWRGGEAMLLSLAYELEAARPWAKRKPLISVR